MAITADNFNKVVVHISSRTEKVHDIRVYQDDDQVGLVDFAGGRRGFFDTDSDQFGYITDRIHEGNADHQWNIDDNTLYTSAANVPVWLEHLLDLDPINPILTEMARVPDDIGPDDILFYKYGTVDTAPDAPTVTFMGNVATLITDMEAAGWYDTPSEADDNKGSNDTSYAINVTYFYDGANDVNTLDITTPQPQSNMVQYSTDHGETWTTTPPDDYDTVTDIRVNVGGYWVDHTIQHETELVETIQNLTGFFYPPYTDYPYSSAVVGTAIQDMQALQFHAFRAQSWSDDSSPQRGFVSKIIPIDEVVWLRPHNLGWPEVNSYYDRLIQDDDEGLYCMAINKESGEVVIGHTNNEDIADYFPNSEWQSWLFGFESYPYPTLYSNISAVATQVTFVGTNLGISVGNIIFSGDEQMRITQVFNPTTDGIPPTDVYTVVYVTRAVNGTSIETRNAGQRVRITVNEDRLRRITFLKGNSVTRPTAIKLMGYEKIEQRVES